MADYDDIKTHQHDLIRKLIRGSLFSAPLSADPVDTLTEKVTNVIALKALPVDYDDAGVLTEDGVSVEREIATSEIRSWGYSTATRTDITSDALTYSFVPQETKRSNIARAVGVAPNSLTLDAFTGELSIEKPQITRQYWERHLVIGVDENDFGEIYVAQFFPRAKVTGFTAQNFAASEEGLTWGVTMTAEHDSALGYSTKWFFAGPGWAGLADKMGWDAITP